MRREVSILGLSYSQSQMGSYVLVLSEKNGNVKLPIIVKMSDAQRIALDIENVKSARPMTHDLFKSVSDSYGIDVQEVYIYSLLEGVFYAKLVTTNGVEEVEVESSVGDAVILASVYDCPIYVANTVLKSAGVLINDDGTLIEDADLDAELGIDSSKPQAKGKVSIENLEKLMDEAARNDDFEMAAVIRDRIAELKGL
jgi:bifunctional DNase/RNase